MPRGARGLTKASIWDLRSDLRLVSKDRLMPLCEPSRTTLAPADLPGTGLMISKTRLVSGRSFALKTLAICCIGCDRCDQRGGSRGRNGSTTPALLCDRMRRNRHSLSPGTAIRLWYGLRSGMVNSGRVTRAGQLKAYPNAPPRFLFL